MVDEFYARAAQAREKHPIVPVSIATPPATLKDPGSPVLMPVPPGYRGYRELV